MSLFSHQVEITAYLYPKTIKKIDNQDALYKRFPLGSPNTALQTLYDEIDWTLAVGFTLKQLVPSVSNTGNMFSVRKGHNFVQESCVHCIDIDLPDAFMGQVGAGDVFVPFTNFTDIPRLATVEEVVAYLENTLHIPSDVGLLVTRSRSQMQALVAEEDSIPPKWHVYVITSSPMDAKVFQEHIKIRASIDQLYIGLQKDGQPTTRHPFIDTDANSAKLITEWGGSENPIALYRPGRTINSAGWVRTHLVKPFTGRPIEVFTEQEQASVLERAKLNKEAREKIAGVIERKYLAGEALEWDEPLCLSRASNGYKAGDMIKASVVVDEFTYNAQFHSLADRERDYGLHYSAAGKMFIDYTNGNSVHLVKLKPLPVTAHKVDSPYIGDHFVKHWDRSKTTLLISQTGSGKTYSLTAIDVGPTSGFLGMIYAVPTHALAQDIAKDYGLIYLPSGQRNWAEEVQPYSKVVMTVDKLMGHLKDDKQNLSAKLLIIDEAHHHLWNPKDLHVPMRELYQGKRNLEVGAIILASATIDPLLLDIPQLDILEYPASQIREVEAVRTLDYNVYKEAKTSLTFKDNTLDGAVETSWLLSRGQTAVNLFGQNKAIDGGYKTELPANLEAIDHIFATRVMREGVSLNQSRDLLVLRNDVTHRSGSVNIVQFLNRLRGWADVALMKIGYNHFREALPEPSLAKFWLLAQAAETYDVLDFELLSFLQLDPLIAKAGFIEDGIVKVSELKVIAYYLHAYESYEVSNFEVLRANLLPYGVDLIDSYSSDDFLSREEVRDAEAASRDELFGEIVENLSDFKMACEHAKTFKKLNSYLYEPSNDPAILTYQMKKKQIKPIESSVVRINKNKIATVDLTEESQVLTQVKESFAEQVKQHTTSIAEGYDLYLGDYFVEGELVPLRQMIAKYKGLVKKVTGKNPTNVTKNDVVKLLKKFCTFTMFAGADEMQTNSKRVNGYRIDKFGVLDEDMFVRINSATPNIAS